LGHSSDWQTSSGKKVHLSLCFNPSHLEFVNPVVLGRVRSKQDRVGDVQRNRGMALLIHGDGGFHRARRRSGDPDLANSPLYGRSTLHVIANNQIRVHYCRPKAGLRLTDGRGEDASDFPIFHVNGEDPEAVAQS